MGTKRIWILTGVAALLITAFGWWFWGSDTSKVSVTLSKQAKLVKELDSLVRQDGNLSQIIEQADELYMQINTKFADSPEVKQAERIMEDLRIRLLFSSVPTENSVLYEVRAGDTLTAIARRHQTTVELIMRANGLQDDRIHVGQVLKVTSGDYNLLISKSGNTLWLKRGDRLVKTYTVSTGQDGITPVGDFSITDKLIDPVWYKAGAVVPPDSPENILGTRWMGIGIPGYGIHGTTEPEALGQAVTNGCVRMRNGEVEELYAIVPSGTKVVIVD